MGLEPACQSIESIEAAGQHKGSSAARFSEAAGHEHAQANRSHQDQPFPARARELTNKFMGL